MDFFVDILKKNKTFIENSKGLCQKVEQECEDFFKEVDLFLQTGSIEYLKSAIYDKENVESIATSKSRQSKKPRPSKTVPANNLDMEHLKIKKEKMSDIQEISEAPESNVQSKEEASEMPAPTKLPPRKRKIKTEQRDLPMRSTRTGTMKTEACETISSNSELIRFSRASDVIIENSVIPTIEISDNETDTGSDKEKTNLGHMRNTRSKMKQLAKENPIQGSDIKENGDEVPKRITRSTRTKTKVKSDTRSNLIEEHSTRVEKTESTSISNGGNECNGTVQSVYEDAMSVIDNHNKIQPENTTYIESERLQNDNENTGVSTVNSTFVVELPKVIAKAADNKQDEYEDTSKTPPFTKKTKQIFSPFANTPLKKKVEAFERLGESNISVKATGTKRPMQKGSAQKGKDYNQDRKESKTVDQKDVLHKSVTPITSKFFPKGVCSTSKISKLHPAYCGSDISTSNESSLSAKSASALKASQAEFRDREKRRQVKERDALKKREALLQAQAEEKRRKREEKQQKVQQQREMLEKEKQKLLEEAEKKRLMAKQKANGLLKEREELMRIAEEKKCAEMKKIELSNMAFKEKLEKAHQPSIPIYMTTKPPLLPTSDCYDSDDPEYDPRRQIILSWCRDKVLREMEMVMIAAGETIKNTFFCRQAQTPDLQEIFELIDRKKLKRTSSAIWRKPPRYTLMPTLEDTIEFSEESD